MGGSESKQKMLTKILTDVVIDVAVSVQSDQRNVSSQEQNFKLSGMKDSKIKGVLLSQQLAVKAESLMQVDVNADFQQQLQASIMNKLEQERSNMPEISQALMSQDVETIVKNSISTKMSIEAISTQVNHFAQKQDFELDNSSGLDVEDVKLIATGDAMYQQSNSLAADIATQLITDTESKNDALNKVNNFISEILDSFGNMLSGPVMIIAALGVVGLMVTMMFMM